MTPAIQQWVEKHVASGVIPSAGPTLEVGSRDVNGTVRQFFNSAAYMGIDMEAGPGVDRVMNLHRIPLERMLAGGDGRFAKPFRTVVCLEVLEHDPSPIKAVGILRDLLMTDGVLVLSSPTTGFPEHRHPKDYWRFMKDTWTDIFFYGMEILAFDEVRCQQGFPGYIGAAKRLA